MMIEMSFLGELKRKAPTSTYFTDTKIKCEMFLQSYNTHKKNNINMINYYIYVFFKEIKLYAAKKWMLVIEGKVFFPVIDLQDMP